MSLTSSSIFDVAGTLSALVVVGLMVFSVYRGVTIGRALVNPVFRGRAYLTAVATALLFTALVSTLLPLGSIGVGSFNLSLIIAPIFYAAFISLFALFDRNILAAMELDFFHRDTLKWKVVRRPLYITWVIFIFYASVIFNWYSTFVDDVPAILQAVDLVATLVLFGGLIYLGLALVLSATRTADHTMRRFVRNLGLFVLVFVIGALFQSSAGVLSLISELLFIISFYFLYLGVMSLSPIGKIVGEA